MKAFDELEEMARKQAAEEDAAAAMLVARARLVLHPDAAWAFFAQMALRLELICDWAEGTMATDGQSIRYNPDFTLALPVKQRIAVLAHEVAHVVLCHHARRHWRSPASWNEAADLSLNGLLEESGFELPACRLMPGEGSYPGLPRGLSAEEYYQLLGRKEKPGGQGEQGGQEGGEEEDDDPGQCGGVKDPWDGSESACRQAESEVRERVAQAGMIARQRGSLPAGLARVVGELLNPKVDWKAALREFLTRHAKNDFKWVPGNRRFAHMGIYLPGLRSEELGEVAVAVDTSGSISSDTLRLFGGEVNGILESYANVKVTVIYHDARVAHVQEWKSSDGPLVLGAYGGGGTDHRPVFEWIEEHRPDLSCLVCLTDMVSCFPTDPPPYPVLWAAAGARPAAPKAPFGSLILVE